jgi:hypothetical protein
MGMNVLQLCARFAFSPNQLGYCGLDSAQKAFYDCIVNGKCEAVREEMKQFKALYPYLKTIGEVLNKDWLDYEVVEAYWLGNESLKKFKPEHYEILIKNLAAQGLPDFFIEEIGKKKPKTFIPLHLFNVLHIGVGQITGSVKYNLENVNNCMVRWGEVLETDEKRKSVQVMLKSLINPKSGYQITNIKYQIIYVPEFLPDLIKGSTVAVHWGQVVKVLEKVEVENLEKWTKTVLTSLENS